MRKQQEKELRRLEAALMEEEFSQEAFPAEEELELEWDAFDDSESYDVYNTDDVDVDLEEYSEDVHRGKSGSGWGIVLTMLCMIALSAGILALLKYLGVL